jgi:2-haloacid dehalogenase
LPAITLQDESRNPVPSIKALSFDCYGTLVDWERGIQAAFEKLLADTPGVAKGITMEAALESFARHESRLEAARPILPYFDVLRQAAKGVGEDIAVVFSDAQLLSFATSVDQWPLFDDVLPFLGRMQDDYLLAILSNVDRRTFAGTLPKFSGAITVACIAEDIGVYKPDPKSFETLLARLAEHGIARDSLLHVAQSQFHDIEPARNLGIKSCWVDRRHDKQGWGAVPQPHSAVSADYQVTSLTQLADLLGR